MVETQTLLNQIYDEVMRRAGVERIGDRMEFFGIMEEVISDYIENGTMHDEEDTKALREGLERKWLEMNRE